ncbi:phosphatidate cytidylyltransferase [Tahibacter amnicola]|uniref:Phosphatidate cytidylyltransferase n=1 Tax=Tahibacter amnicola TaxID=2976241 RepID=A0ABY6B9Q4_9GAMM|nr:phosphatidate cytidylyltransferase [Tahibacter amnicola]UXI66798.1 phosphatidate cytidylyltransferase [Tahibacter amnicola]
MPPKLKTRTLTALVLAPLAIALILLAPTAVLAVVAAGAFLMAAWEWTRMVGLRALPIRGAVIGAHVVAMAVLWWYRDGAVWWAVIGAGVAWWLVATLWLRRFSFAVAPTHENASLKTVAGLFVIVPAWCALLQLHASPNKGPWWALFGLMLVWVADSGAYLAGSRWGRTKLAPRISPGKTWAGVYGAIASSAIVGVIGAWLLGTRHLALAGVFVLAMVTVVASIVGDLFESLIKRHANVKDSGDLFPGHGGMFDRLDSVFAALPVWAAGLALLAA